jgi:hypothetical protein
MVFVFVSHSKHDRQLVNFFSNIFADIGLRGMFYEWQIVPNDYAGRTITSIIRNRECAALFVLLGRNLQRPPTSTPQFTHNWVSFEVGIAAGIGKPIWVFEEYNTEIKFPVPYVTDYG